jgi:hypothetical protein
MTLGMTKRQAVLIASAAQRAQAAIAELHVGAAHLRARKVGTSPPEYYDLTRLIVELQGVEKRLRAKLGEPS